MTPERQAEAYYGEWTVKPRRPRCVTEGVRYALARELVERFCAEMGLRLWRLEHPTYTEPRKPRGEEHD